MEFTEARIEGLHNYCGSSHNLSFSFPSSHMYSDVSVAVFFFFLKAGQLPSEEPTSLPRHCGYFTFTLAGKEQHALFVTRLAACKYVCAGYCDCTIGGIG
jgi:hypothetical protein